MTHSEDIAEHMREQLDNPLRDNITKAARISNDLGIDRSTAGAILSKMEQGAIDGVELSVWSTGNGGGRKYTIEHVADEINDFYAVDESLCVKIRKDLKTGRLTLSQLSEKYGVSITQTRRHGSGLCDHDVSEPEAHAIGKGAHRTWVELP